jgi:predicted acylesterase/phospholipase RssA
MPGAAGGHGYRSTVRPGAGGEAASAGALRLAVTLPGGIAPGTLEAGATCGLLAWIQEVNARQADAVLIDVISGASAGALSGLLAARVLLGGDDPVGVFRQAWVSAPSLRTLQEAGPWAPLSLRPAREVARRILFAPPAAEAAWRQRDPVILDAALGCLRGFSRRIPSHDASDPEQRLIAATYLDWSSIELPDVAGESDVVDQHWTRALDSAIASASHPLAFRARRLDRDRSQYLRRGIVNLPVGKEDLHLWYTDGGLVDNEPLGRCVRCVAERDGAPLPSRLVMLIRSRIRWPAPADNPAWSGHRRPRWTQTLARVLDLIASNAAGIDLLQVEQTNERVRATKEVAAGLVELLDRDEATRDRLQKLLELTEAQRRPLTPVGASVAPEDPKAGDLSELLEKLLLSASGLVGKQPVEVAVVSADRASIGPQALGSVIGFLERRQREEHFAAGYWSMLAWIEEAATLKKRLPADLIGAGVLAARSKVSDPGLRADRRLPSKLSPTLRLELFRLGVRTGLIARADIDAVFDAREQPSAPLGRPRRRAGTRPRARMRRRIG